MIKDMEEQIKKRIMEAIRLANSQINEEIQPYLNDYKGPFSDIILENCQISQDTGLPLCQDTGMLEFFCFLGIGFHLKKPLQEILDEAVSDLYTHSPYRYSTVDDPLFERKNRLNNTPAIVHINSVHGNSLEISFLVKGGGSENLSGLYMMSPSSTKEELTDQVVQHIKASGARACPPLKVGIGLGGTSEKAMMLSKLALTQSISQNNPDKRYALLEADLKKRINNLKIGFQGLGTGSSCYSVHILIHPTHIATLPLAISVDCYLCRRGRVSFEG